MGLWYFLLFLIGISFITLGLMNKQVSMATKVVMLLFIFGVLFVIVSVFMFLPGSDEFIADLLELGW